MRRLLTLLAIAGVLAGCASTALPTCDGNERRPINVPPRAEIVYPSCGAAV
jgi:hypothetical protein